MSSYDDIRSALEVQLNSVVGIPSIAWEGRKFTPTTGTPYVQPIFIPTSRRNAVIGINPQLRYQGVFKLLFKYPEGNGAGPSEDSIDNVLDSFKPTQDLSFTNSDDQTVYVTIDYSEQMGAYTESPWYTTPVNIGWHSYN